MRVRNWALLTLGIAGVVSVGAGIAETTPKRAGAAAPPQNEQVAGLLAARSPGERGAAAVSVKEPVFKQAAWTPTYPTTRALGERAPAPAEYKVAAVAPSAIPAAPVPATAVAPAVLAPAPVPPTAVASVATAAPVAVAPVVAAAATGGSSLGAAALLPAIPLVLAAGGGGGGGSANVAPAVPEPSTWMMMISGFAMLGFALRRRRRQLRHSEQGGTAGAGFAAQQC
jgi:hypothetical protein